MPPLRPLATALAVLLASPLASASAQTFVQLSDMGSQVGPRLTRTVAQARIGRSLFGRVGTKVSFIESGIAYQLASDPEWARVLVGRWGEWVHAYNNGSGVGGRFVRPEGLDVSARKKFYVADRGKTRLVVADFDPAQQALVNGRTAGSQGLPTVDVAWDGRTTPLTQDYLYSLQDTVSYVSYWDFNGADPATPLWSYGTTGNGTGQFLYPSGICAGKTPAANGGTQFTADFYVVDRGNRRVVRLSRGASGPSWVSTVSLSGWDPRDCAVDHFGNVYVADQVGHQLHKFTFSLMLLSSYGSYGKGATNLNTFAFPHAISVPCGLKVVNSQTVWYCEGRVITAEEWSDSSGAVEHYLGVDGWITAGPYVGPDGADIFYNATDHALHTVDVAGTDMISVRYIANGVLMSPGEMGWDWDGRREDGSIAPPGNYVFRVGITSVYGPGYPWATKSLISQPFYFSYTAPPPCKRPPCFAPPAEPVGSEPTALFFHQRVITAPQPLARIGGPAAAAPAVGIETGSGTLTALVRQYGVRGLSFGITREASASPVVIRVYSLSGRQVRTLVNERLEPGLYEIGWDGLDDRGRPAGPGVYFAALTAGGQRFVQRLILRQAP
jgi:flagellar hook assembly protein FlgD